MSEQQKRNNEPLILADFDEESEYQPNLNEEMFRIILNCFKEKIEINTIAKVTGIPLEIIKRLHSFIRQKNKLPRRSIFSKRELIIGLKTVKIVMKSITAREYYNYYQNSIALFRDAYFELILHVKLKHNAPGFGLAQGYAAMKTLFGESTTMYDDYKCSFGYTFLLEVSKNDRSSRYLLNFIDFKGGWDFRFEKVLAADERGKFNTETLHKPFEDEFSTEDTRCFMEWFIFYLIGFMKSYQAFYREEFSRSNRAALAVYGYKGGKFFNNFYEKEHYFHKIIGELKEENIPYNQVTPNK